MRISDWSSDVCSSDLSIVDRAFNWRFSVLAAIGLSLPIALGLPFVSMPMAVIVLVMITAGAHRGAASFLLGWVLGISAVVAVTIVIADYSFAESESSQTSVWSSVVRIVLGRSEEHTSELQSLMRISY